LFLSRVGEFPDDLQRWPVEMVLEVKIKDLKKLFSDLSAKIMGEINASGGQGRLFLKKPPPLDPPVKTF
jgi:hypothetical protein